MAFTDIFCILLIISELVFGGVSIYNAQSVRERIAYVFLMILAMIITVQLACFATSMVEAMRRYFPKREDN